MTSQSLGKQLLTVSDAFGLRRLFQTGPLASSLLAFHDTGAGVAVEWIAVRLEQSVLILTKQEGKGVKHFIGSEPDEFGVFQCHARLEDGLVGFPHNAVDAIGSDDQIKIAEIR